MRPSEFKKYLGNPLLLEPAHIAELQQLVLEFPYFQAAHLLLTLAGKRHDARVYQQSLQKTAIVASSRLQLYHLVESMDLEAHKIQIQEETPVQEAAQELNILKAAELSTGFSEAEAAKTVQLQEDTVLAELEVPALPVRPAEPKKTEEIKFEEEIGKQVVNAFVERDILKTPQLHKTPLVQEPESFGDWLSFLKKNNGQSYGEISGAVDKARAKKERDKEQDYLGGLEKFEDRKQKNKAIIDKIIETNPGLIRNKEEPKFYAPDTKAKESLLENEHLVTETLARIYALQGSVNKAVRAYEILSLKYPQKSAYFASLIEKLKNNQ
jgi:hypothetical protein